MALQAWSNIGARLSRGPIAPCQSQSDRKFPPGRRQKPEFSDLAMAVVSARQPRMLSEGISETAPILNWPWPWPVISSRASVASAVGVKLKSARFQSALGAERATVWRSLGAGPQTRVTSTFAPGSPAIWT